ncbi:MAG: cell division protein ZapB [Bacteroidales bacterium]|nr:cell division protein ZapB [Bacteroidales bacterium]
MLTLDKVQLLEDRIKKAVTLIQKLRDENTSLSEELDMLKMHNDELKDFAKSLGNDTKLIEESITNALDNLKEVGTEVTSIDQPTFVTNAEYEEADTFISQEGAKIEEIELPEDDPIDDIIINLGPEDDIPIY